MIKFKELAEKSGAGDWGTDELTSTLRKGTPGQGITDIGLKNKERKESIDESIDDDIAHVYQRIKHFEDKIRDEKDPDFKADYKFLLQKQNEKLRALQDKKRKMSESVELDEAQWGADNPYKKYKNDPERLRRMLRKNQDAAGNMRNRISKFMGSSPQGLKDELRDIENRIKQIKDVMRESVDLEEEKVIKIVANTNTRKYKEGEVIKTFPETKAGLTKAMVFQKTVKDRYGAETTMVRESVELDEGKLDKSSPIYKEYESLKKKPVADLRNIIGRSHRVVDLKGYDKAGAIRQILDDRYGEKKVDAFFGFSEEVELDEGAVAVSTVEKEIRKNGATQVKKSDREITFMYKGSERKIPVDRGFVKSDHYMKLQDMMENLQERPFGGDSVIKDLLPGIYNFLDRTVNNKRYQFAVRMFLDLRKKNPNDARNNLIKAAKIADVDVRVLDRLFRNMVKKGVMPKHLMNYYPTFVEDITEKLKVSDGLGAWIKDFQDSDAPQFKDADSKKRRDMAIAAFTAAGGKLDEGSETWEAGYDRRVVKTTKPEHKEKGYNWRIKGKDRPEISIKLYKEKPSFKEFTKQMKRVAGHEFGG